MVITEEFLKHFDICNQADFRLKSLFYKIKTTFLTRHGVHSGYDQQFFVKWFCDSCKLTVTNVQMERCSLRRLDSAECTGGVMASRHAHILSRYDLTTDDGKITKTYHCPTGEFLYENCFNSSYDKKSRNYDTLNALVSDIVSGTKEPNKKITKQQAWESLKFLINYARHQYSRKPSVRLKDLEFYAFADKDKIRRYKKLRERKRVVFECYKTRKNGVVLKVFIRHWQTTRGIRSGEVMVWPKSVHYPVRDNIYSAPDSKFKLLVTLSNQQEKWQQN